MEVQVHHSHVISNASTSSLSAPTFTAYSSSENLGDIAARVVGELNLSSDDPYEDDFYASLADHHHPNDVVEQKQDDHHDHVDDQYDHHDDKDDDEESDDESEFEFAVVGREGEEYSSPISADEIFADGQIRPMFPLFNTDLVFGSQNDDVSEVRLPLRKLLSKERENTRVSVSSASSDDNLDRIPSGTYCVWTPKKKSDKSEPDKMIGKKSRSTGSSSKRFRIRDLLYRSNSDGKDTFVFLTPPGGDHKRRDKTTPSSAAGKKGGGDAKKKSYLPYRRDLVGLFTNVNGISRTVRPF